MQKGGGGHVVRVESAGVVDGQHQGLSGGVVAVEHDC
jgi:hypothetical protein